MSEPGSRPGVATGGTVAGGVGEVALVGSTLSTGVGASEGAIVGLIGAIVGVPEGTAIVEAKFAGLDVGKLACDKVGPGVSPTVPQPMTKIESEANVMASCVGVFGTQPSRSATPYRLHTNGRVRSVGAVTTELVRHAGLSVEELLPVAGQRRGPE